MSTALAPAPTVPSQDYPTDLTGASPAETALHSSRQRRQPRVVSHPEDVLHLVLRQMEAVTTKKEEFTIALKGLTYLTKQLVRVYAAHMHTISALQVRVKALEAQVGPPTQVTVGNDSVPQGRV